MPFEDFLKPHGINYTVCRDKSQQRTELGLPDKGFIMFRPGTDIKASDVLVNPAGEKYHVAKTETEFAYGKPHFLKAFYQTEQEYNAAKQSSAPVFNVQNAYGSVIGTGNQATINYDFYACPIELQKSAAPNSGNCDVQRPTPFACCLCGSCVGLSGVQAQRAKTGNS